MKRLMPLVALLLCGCSFGHSEWDSKAKEYANMNFIGVPSILGLGVTGSSTPVTENLSVTNKHVAYPLMKQISKKSVSCDAAIISQDNKGEVLRPWANMKQGDYITIYGYSAMTLMPVSSKGKVVRFSYDGGCFSALTTAGAVSGMSGGAVVNDKGQLVGILRGGEYKSGMTVVIPFQTIADIFPVSVKDQAQKVYQDERNNRA